MQTATPEQRVKALYHDAGRSVALARETLRQTAEAVRLSEQWIDDLKHLTARTREAVARSQSILGRG
jgi:hypothetical protein